MGFIPDKQFQLFAVGNILEIDPNNFQSSALCTMQSRIVCHRRNTKKILNTIFHLFIPKIWKLILRANSIHFLCWLVLRSLELYQAHLVDNFLHSCYLSAFEIVRIIYIPITPGGQKSKDLPPALLRWRTSYTRAWQRNGTNCSQGLAQVGKGFLKLKNNKNRLRYLTSFEQMSIPGVSSVQ